MTNGVSWRSRLLSDYWFSHLPADLQDSLLEAARQRRKTPGQRLFDGVKSCLPLPSSGQAEALTFVNDHDFVLSNEKGKLYRATRRGDTAGR